MSNQTNRANRFLAGCACLAVGLYFAGTSFQNDSPRLYSSKIDPVFEQDLAKVFKKGRDGNWSDARSFLIKHSKTDNPEAKLRLAVLNLKGWGTKRNLEKARELLLQAVQYDFPGRGEAAFELGRVYRLSKGPDCPRIAFEWFSKAISWGFAKAHNELGKSYARGLGVQADYDKSIRHYSLAIDHGSISAVAPLFEIALIQQKDGNADPARGRMMANTYLPLLEEDAKSGNRTAARTLGRIHSRGLFVEQNKKQALRWFALASSQGDAVAMHDLAILNLTMKKDKDRIEKSIAFLEDSAELGYPAAMTALGRLFIKDGKFQDAEKAIKYLTEGVKSGHAGSMAELAKLHFEGKLVPKNVKQAKIFAELGALQKHLGSKKILVKITRYEKENGKTNSAKLNSEEG